MIATKPLGSSGLRLSTLGLGTAGIGNLYQEVDEGEAQRTVTRAVELGVTYIDTAPHYGAGLAEERAGRALRQLPRDRFVLSSKVGRLLRSTPPRQRFDGHGFVNAGARERVWDFSAAGIRRSLEDSLTRLGLDRLDIAYLHDPDNFEDDARRSALPTLLELRADGLVRAVGAGMNQAEMLDRFVADFDLDVILLAGQYNLLDHGALTSLLPRCAERGVGVVIGGALGSGILADPRPGAYYHYAPAPATVLHRAQQLAAVCSRHGVSLAAAALQFPLGHPAVVSVLNGVGGVSQLEANVEAFETTVPAEVWAELREEGLLPLDVPVPDARG